MPNKQKPAMKLVSSVKAFTQWQSTLTYLKNPPEGYGLPATDIMGGLDAIMANVTAGSFRSEYDFQVAMTLLIAGAHDGHFGFRPDIFKGFSFRNDLAADLVSVSVDGIQTPKLYNLRKQPQRGDTSPTPRKVLTWVQVFSTEPVKWLGISACRSAPMDSPQRLRRSTDKTQLRSW